MRVNCDSFQVRALKSDWLCLMIPEDGWGDEAIGAVDKILDGQLRGLKRKGHFSGAALERMSFVPHPAQQFERVMLVGLGKKSAVSVQVLRRAAGVAGQLSGIAKTLIVLPALPAGTVKLEQAGQAVAEGFLLGGYRDLRFRGEHQANAKGQPSLGLVAAGSAQISRLRAGAQRGAALAELQNQCRDLSGAPSNVLTPTALAAEARKLARKSGLRATVFGRRQIAKFKMGAFLAVANGSQEPPQLIRLEYAPKGRARKKVVLVGKGVTFDSGGISIKPAENMFEMRQDMTGAAVVITVMAALARFKPDLAVTAFIPCCENMPSASAYKPGDVVTTSIGKTIEIINTDAEGRLLLADALGHAAKLKPDYLVDVATLTGAATVALGNAGAATLSTSDYLVEKFMAASEATGEKIWRLPLWEEYEAQIKSNLADMLNSGGKPAGTITAALLLKKFTGGIPWLHLDIAAVDYEYRGNEITPRGPSGFGVRLVTEALLSI